jgi:hypothetical protein
MGLFRAILLALLIVAMPLGASAQTGSGPRELPGGPWPSPVVRPSPCQVLRELGGETQKHGAAIRRANERKASVQEACKLFKTFLAAEANFIKELEDNSRTCRVPSDWIKEVKDKHAKASQIGKEFCDMAARGLVGPMLLGPTRWEAPRNDSRKPGQFRDYEDNCDLCGKTGDFWWLGQPTQ